MRSAIALLIFSASLMLAGCGDSKKPLADQAKDAANKAKDKVAGTAGDAKNAVSDGAKKKAESIQNFAGDRVKLPE